jgi:uncharacterized sulfatase
MTHLKTSMAKSGKKPNVVIVIADDLNREDISCYGGKNVKTPNIDKIASQGMRFNYAFTATAMCAPMRMQLYTGLFPVRNGAYPNHSAVKPGTKSVAHHMGALGYRVGLIGKAHYKPQESFPFEKLKGKLDPQQEWPEVVDFMLKDKKQPFCLFVCSHEPHTPWNKGDSSVFKAEKLILPPYIADTQVMREALCRYLAEVKYYDDQVGRMMKHVEKAGLSHNTIFMVFSEQGAQIPGGKWTCYAQGLQVGIVARWPGKIKPNSESNAMVNYIDVVPTLIEAAGGDPKSVDTGNKNIHGKTEFDGKSFLNVLLGKTDQHNKYAYGVQTSAGAIGAPKSGYPVRSVRTKNYKFVLNLNHEAEYSNAVTSKSKKGYWNSWLEGAEKTPAVKKLVDRYLHRPAEEFYDIRNDHYELNNLANNPEFKKIKEQLKEELLNWMKSQDDKGLETELSYKKQKSKKKDKKKKKQKSGKKSKGNISLDESQTFFEFQQGDSVKLNVPIHNRPFTIKAIIQSSDPEGVIFSQGAKNSGYALYVQEGELCMTINRGTKKSKTVKSNIKTSSQNTTIECRVQKDGMIILLVNEEQVASGKGFFLSKTPAGALSVGFDADNLVGEYKDEFKFNGIIKKAVLKLD